LPVAISRFTGGEDPRHLTLAAASAVSITFPIIIVILVFQKNLVKGLASGAVKG
jgi:multiple sugar transport system permease protein